MVAWERALEVIYGMHDLATDMPRVAAGFGVIVGGFIATYLVYTLLSYTCLGRRWKAERLLIRYDENGRPEWRRRPYPGAWRNARHLFVLLVIFVMVVTTIWFAAAMAGFNPATTAITTLTIGVVLSASLTTVFKQAFASVIIHTENRLVEGEHWRFNKEHEGIITEIRLLEVEMLKWNAAERTSELIVVPIDWFTSQGRSRKFATEIDTPVMAEDDVNAADDDYLLPQEPPQNTQVMVQSQARLPQSRGFHRRRGTTKEHIV